MGKPSLTKVDLKRSSGVLAFTLMEILVTISVILLLVGILVPVLGSARESGRRVKCQSNLRQLSTANSAYATDSKGWFCTSKPTAATAASERSSWQTHDSEMRIRVGVSSGPSFMNWVLWGNLYQSQSYLNGQGQSYYCPSAPSDGFGLEYEGGYPELKKADPVRGVFSSYYQRGAVQGALLNTKGQITTSSTSPLLAANWQQDNKPRRAMLCDNYGFTIEEGVKPNHPDGLEVLYSDHTVKWYSVPRKDWINTTGPASDGSDNGATIGSWNQLDRGQLE